jgi:hypothetical protein
MKRCPQCEFIYEDDRVCAIWTEYYSSLTLLTFRNRKHLPSQICEADSFQLSQPSFLEQYFFSFTTFPLIGRDQLQRPVWMRLMQRNNFNRSDGAFSIEGYSKCGKRTKIKNYGRTTLNYGCSQRK